MTASDPAADALHPTVTGGTPTAGGVDPSWRRLSPRMLLVHPFQEIPRALPAIFGIFLAGSTSGHDWWGIASLGAVVVGAMLRWFTTTYRITPDYVQVRRGLLRRRELSVPRDRVRTVDVTAHALHRLVGLARVEVGTGRSDRKDEGVRLDGLSAAEAARLREELLHQRPQPVTGPAGTGVPVPSAVAATSVPAGVTAPVRETELVRLSPDWVRYGPFTLSGLVTVGVVAAFVSRTINETHVDPTRYGPMRALAGHLAHAPVALAGAEVFATCVAVVAVASTFGYVLAFWGFRLTRHPAGTLHVTRGLLTARATTIEERRLRGVEISEPLLLRLVGGARCIAIATGLRVGRGAERGGSMLLPPAPRAEAERVAGAVLSDPRPATVPLTPHGPRAARRRYTRALAAAVLVVAVPVAGSWLAGWPAWTWQVALVALPVAGLLAYDRARSLGHALIGGRLVTRQGSLVRRRCVLDTGGVIGWNLNRSFFQRRAGLATLTATTAAGHQHYAVPDVDLPEALRLADESTPGLLAPFLERHPSPTSP
ncbi:PH domain-containing protein [Planosporangium sp. 12N6]|uniref:PH domain-containing protein n=1 Tax=Planosporangium spinosum TaxID=3402278 RepID=UPI003CE77BA2